MQVIGKGTGEMSSSPQRRIAYTIAAASVVIPIMVMLWNIELGIILFFMGLIVAYRAIRYGAQDDLHSLNDAAEQKLSRHQIERGRTIFVQIVDDFGRDLPPATVQKLMADAQAQAGPRDTVVPVRHKISREGDHPILPD
jgi:hypothetical protein